MLFRKTSTEAEHFCTTTRNQKELRFPFGRNSYLRDSIPTDEAIFFVLNLPLPGELMYIRPGESIITPVDDCCNDMGDSIYEPFVFGDSLYYLVYNRNLGNEMWRTSIDGRVTEQLSMDASGWRQIFGRTRDTFIFLKRSDEVRYALYSWSPSTGEVFLRNLTSENEGLDTARIGTIGDKIIIFSASWNDPRQLISTDGTKEGTRIIQSSQEWIYPDYMASLDDLMVFSMRSAELGDELWRTDGTKDGTFLVKDIYPGSMSSDPERFRLIDNEIYFRADDGIHGVELWKSDGTSEGTMLAADLFEGPGGSFPAYATLSDNGVIVSAATDQGGSQLSLIDPTSGGDPQTLFVNSGTSDSRVRDIVSTPGAVFFEANDSIAGRELWRSNGTSGGTELISDAREGSAHSDTDYLGEVGPNHVWIQNESIIYFNTTLDNWSEFATAGEVVEDVTNSVASGDDILVALRTEQAGNSFWSVDISAERMSLVWGPGESTSNIQVIGKTRDAWIVLVDGNVFPLTDFGPGERLFGRSLLLTPYLSAHLGEKLLFTDGQHFLATDGTAGGTATIANMPSFGSAPHVIGDIAIFAGRQGEIGRELFTTDGTPQGTRVLTDLFIGRDGSDPLDLLSHNGLVFFTALNSARKRVLWVTDGTASGTLTLWSDFGWAENHELDLELLATFENKIIYSINHEAYGREFWMSDGTPQGTLLLADILPGNVGSNPDPGGNTDDFVFFSASTPEYGRELWQIRGDFLITSTATIGLPEQAFSLSSVYPNPFVSNARLTLTPIFSEHVDASLFDVLGRKIATLFEGWVTAGDTQDLIVDGSQLADGMYIIRVSSQSSSATRLVSHIR